ncbi:helix-turn-helix domain-containing protein, partial [Frankia sp. CcWB2]
MDENESNHTVGSIDTALGSWRLRRGLSARDVAWKLGISLAALTRIETGAIRPTPAQQSAIKTLIEGRAGEKIIFSSHVPGAIHSPSLFDVSDSDEPKSPLLTDPLNDILDRITKQRIFLSTNAVSIGDLLADHQISAPTSSQPPSGAVSAGKNTYTYDAH